MKKFFTFAVALMASVAMMAETEASPSSVTKDADYVGTSYTFNGTYIAGGGSAKVGAMPNKGVKARLNKSAVSNEAIANALEFTTNEGYQITGITIVGITNSDNKAATVGTIYVDGVAWNGTFDGTLPAKNASAASNIVVSNIAATQSVIFAFSDLGGATQANITYTVEYETATPSTDPKLTVSPAEVSLNATAAVPNPSAKVVFSGKNLAAGEYMLNTPKLAGLSVAPASVTVGEDGKLNAEVTISYTSAVEVAATSTTIGLTISGLTKNVTVNYSAVLEKKYMSSINIEQFVFDNGTKADIKAALTAANIEYQNIDALDTLNDLDNKTNRNYAFLGLKMKKTDAKLAGWLKAGQTIKVRFGNVGANFKVSSMGMDSICTAANFANTSTESNKVLEFTAPIDMYLEIVCNSTSTLVIKQIMVNQEIAPVVLPTPSAFLITIAQTENGKVTATWENKKYRTPVGALVTLNITSDEGYAVHNITVNGEALVQSAPGAPITFTMPAEDVTVAAEFGSIATNVEKIEGADKAVKRIINGQLLIEKNGVLYDMTGQIVK